MNQILVDLIIKIKYLRLSIVYIELKLDIDRRELQSKK